MASLISPVLFSKHFSLPKNAMQKAGLIDPILNADTKLFIDPLLIKHSQDPLMRKHGISLLSKKYSGILELLATSQNEGDVAWKAARRQLDLDERPETGLGYGGASTSGSSRPEGIRLTILKTAKEIVTLGEKNPEVIPLMGLFEEGVGPDTISDMTSTFLMPVLCDITTSFCLKYNVPLVQFANKYGNAKLPENPFRLGSPVILVPRDVLRHLPFANDWADVSKVVLEVKQIRDSVNDMLGDIAKATIAARKAAIRKASLSSLSNLKKVLAAISNASESYDEKADLDGLYTFRKILTDDPKRFIGLITAPSTQTAATLRVTVDAVIQQFKEQIEDNNLWELLWNGDQPRHERAAQLLFFSVANVICAVNNVDISPETNSGGGPVDFKFSTGYQGRLLVEIKLSTGRVVDGYKKQLERYKRAAKTNDAIFLVVDIDGMRKKYDTILRMQAEARKRGEKTSEIIYVDAQRQQSASKL